MKKLFAFVLIIGLAICVYYWYHVAENTPAKNTLAKDASDINMVASELMRAKSAIVDARLARLGHTPSWDNDINGQIQVYSQIITANKQAKTDTKAFLLGVYVVGWANLDIAVKKALHGKSYNCEQLSRRAEKQAMNNMSSEEMQLLHGYYLSVIYFREFRKIQRELGIDDKMLMQMLQVNNDAIIPKMREWDRKVKP